MANPQDNLTPIPKQEHSWCHETVQDVSRTFALTIDILDEPMSTYICVGYLMCRVADTIEDTKALSPTEKTVLLEQYGRVLDSEQELDADRFEESLDPYLPPERSDEWEVVAESSRVIRTFERMPTDVRKAIIAPTRELVSGMALFVERYADQGGIRIQSVDELEEYCYYVAGTVGHLITNLIVREVDDEQVARSLRSTAEGFGQLLQLVNIAKDVHADYTEENNVYLPREWLNEVGASQEALIDPQTTQNVATVVERTGEHARSYIDDAQSYLDTLAQVDQNAFVAWAVPFLLAVGTLRELTARPEDSLSPGGVKISRDEVTAVVTAVTTATDPQELSSLRQAVRRGTLK